ncbi:MAG: hypothetical protein H7Z42_11650 [Roseiflexaceae bacterium]|nr:hypothetical protein [Roseiflexaceae bacterium]
MNNKKVSFGAKPAPKPAVAPADQWVETRTAEEPIMPEVTRRLTLDLPESLHRRIKATCAQRGVKMVDEIRMLLEQHFPN